MLTTSQIFGLNVKAKRNALHIGTMEFARQAKIHHGIVHALERGRYNPRFETITRIAETLQCSVDELFKPIDWATEEAFLWERSHPKPY